MTEREEHVHTIAFTFVTAKPLTKEEAAGVLADFILHKSPLVEMTYITRRRFVES